MQPLTELTKKRASNVVEWNSRLVKSFQECKEALFKTPVLKLPNMDQEFKIRTDASDTALGCVLLQDENGKKHPVTSYISRKLSERKENIP